MEGKLPKSVQMSTKLMGGRVRDNPGSPKVEINQNSEEWVEYKQG